MLRTRPRRVVPRWLRHPSTAWLFLASLYLTATVVNVLLAFRMATRWPILLAGFLAAVTAACTLAAIGAWRRR